MSVDVYSKYVFLEPLQDKTARSVEDLFDRRPIKDHTAYDNGSEFLNAIITELVTISKINQRLISPYHPRANGVAEKTVGIMKNDAVKTHTRTRDHLGLIYSHCVNNSVHSTTKAKPFKYFYSRPSNPFIDYSEAHLRFRWKIIKESDKSPLIILLIQLSLIKLINNKILLTNH